MLPLAESFPDGLGGNPSSAAVVRTDCGTGERQRRSPIR